MKQLLLVGAFGAAGAITRYAVSLGMVRWLGDRFAWGTLLVNVVGCACLGALFQWEQSAPLVPREWRIALAAGFLGGLTTFSTFGLETVRWVESGRPTLAIANVLANVLIGLAAVWIGMLLIRGIYWQR